MYIKHNLYLKISKLFALVVVCTLFCVKASNAQEITAIDFNGDLIGKVIPDGKVVSFDNQLIGNINADSLILNFDGELIGGIVPQGIAIGNDNKLLGKVNNDGTVRLPSGKVIGKTLPNGLVVDEYYEIIGFVLFPGLIYSDEGKTVGRLTGDGNYTNLQGQRIGFVSADGHAYRRVGNDYVLDGRLISSRMVVSNTGEFIGSVSPSGEVTDFDAKVIGRVKANGFVYDSANKIIGSIVSTGYAFDNYGKYLGFINYNGEVVNKEQLIGRLNSQGNIMDLSGKTIGYSVDFAATYADLTGKYIGRIIPNGKIVKAKDIVADAAPRGVAIKAEKAVGSKIGVGPIFDYRGELIAHAQRNASVVLFEGTPIGLVIGNYAYNKSGQIIGGIEKGRVSIDTNNNILGINNISSYIGTGEDRFRVSPFGYVFSPEGKISGRSVSSGMFYSDGIAIAELSPNGEVINRGSVISGRLTSLGVHLNADNRIIGKTINANFVVTENGNEPSLMSHNYMVYNGARKILGKVLPDNVVVNSISETSRSLMPKIGEAYSGNIVVGVNGNFIGYADVTGLVRDTSNSIIGQVIERGFVLDNNGAFLGEMLAYNAVVDDKCDFIGVLTPRGEIRNTKDVYIGRALLNDMVISDSGSQVGHIVNQRVIIDDNGNIIGTSSPDGKVLNYKTENLGCLNYQGILRNSEGQQTGVAVVSNPAMGLAGKIIGRINLDGILINNEGASSGYVQISGNVNSKTGVPLGNVFKYRFAFNNKNQYMGIVLDDGTVLGSGNKKSGKVDFYGYVINGSEQVGYALYDLYVYDESNRVIGYIANDGNAMSLSGQNIGRVDKGFVIDRTGKITSRGNRDFFVRNEINVIIGQLKLNGDLVDTMERVIGKINPDTGLIADTNGTTIGQAHALQYYSKAVAVRPVYDENGRIIGYVGEDGSVVNEDGKIIALLNENGLAVSANGEIIGGIGTDWYEKAPRSLTPKKGKDNIEVGVIDYSVQDKAKRSFAIALTPDGEYLGRILDDGTVVDDAGNAIGVRLGDGLIIDNGGGLIGIEESVKSDFGGNIFVPSGTFGPGAAYGTGVGAGGNLGPGGGFGPGERYDPQRAAALAAAQEERRQNISVGKISTNINVSSFTGTQPNWDEQGVGKTISSWRVDLSEMILADKPIPAVLARSIDSRNPTPVTAVVERNVYAEEGRNIIIPAGSRLIGSFGSATGSTEATSNSAKVSINWERLIRPDGSIFVFQGVSGDAMGRGGVLGYLDQQLFKKYSLPLLTTMLTSATVYAMAPNSSSSGETETPKQQAASDARANFEDKMSQIFDNILQDKLNIEALNYVPVGTRIIVFPNIDLWVRTPARDELEGVANMNKKDLLIDDKQTVADQQSIELRKKVSGNQVGGNASSVVYEEDRGDVKAQRTPLIDDSNTAKSTGSTPPPPPPPSFGSSPSASTGSGGSSGSSATTPTGRVPQLF